MPIAHRLIAATFAALSTLTTLAAIEGLASHPVPAAQLAQATAPRG